MRPYPRLSLEPLEGRSLLSTVSPAGSGLSSEVTLDRSAYQVGQSVVVSYTTTNTSNHDVTVVHGPLNQGFTVTQAGHSVWRSNSGIQPQFLQAEVLHPHQSITIQATWDGRSNQADPANSSHEGRELKGTFVVHNELDPDGSSATFTIGVPQIKPPGPSVHAKAAHHHKTS